MRRNLQSLPLPPLHDDRRAERRSRDTLKRGNGVSRPDLENPTLGQDPPQSGGKPPERTIRAEIVESRRGIEDPLTLKRSLLVLVALAALATAVPATADAAASPAGLTGIALDGAADLAWQPVAGASA